MTFEIKTDTSGRVPIIQYHLFVMVPVFFVATIIRVIKAY